MEVLSVLTPRFLSGCHHRDDDSNNFDPRMSPWQELHSDVPPTTSLSDNTHKYLTDRWSNGVMSDFILPSSPFGGSLPAVEMDVVPMWISPSTSLVPTPSSSFSPATSLPPRLPKVPSLDVPHISQTSTESIFTKKDLIEVPAVIFIRSKLAEGCDHIDSGLASAAYTLLVEENDDLVSVLADNPDEDDVAVLPLATYDVLANIFDEIYKDDCEVNDEDADHETFNNLRTQTGNASKD